MKAVRGLTSAVRNITGTANGTSASDGRVSSPAMAARKTQEMAESISAAATQMVGIHRMANATFRANGHAVQFRGAHVISPSQAAALRGDALRLGPGGELSTNVAKNMNGFEEAKNAASEFKTELTGLAAGVTGMKRLASGVREVAQSAKEMPGSTFTSHGVQISTAAAKEMVRPTQEQIAERREAYWAARNARWNHKDFGAHMSQHDRLANAKGLAADVINNQKAAQAVSESTRQIADAQQQINPEVTSAQALELGKSFMQANNSAGLLQMKIDGLKEKLGRGIATGSMDQKQIAELGMQIMKLEEQQRKAAEAAGEHRSALERLKEGAKTVKGAINGLLHPLFNLFGQFVRIAKYRLFRAAIREITEGFSTGLKNVREYSKAIGGLYAKDMQGLDDRLLQMKNSLGAMAASLVQTLIPVFQQLVSWVMELANWINQLIALLSGRTSWTKAVAVEAASDSLDDVKDSANGARKAINNLLASWDELNIIQSQSGGGGGVGGGSTKTETDYTKMFEESTDFDSGVLGAFKWIEEHMPEINALVGTLLLRLAGLKGPWAILLGFGIAESFASGYQAAIDGESFDRAVEDSIIGMATVALGGAFLGAKAGGLAGALVGITVGVAISLVATEIGWLVGEIKARGESEFEQHLMNNLLQIIGNTALFGVTGFIMGSQLGHPVAGALIGVGIGAAISLAALVVEWDESTRATTVGEFFRARLGSAILTGLAGGGLTFLLASEVLGVAAGTAALVGITVGVLITLVATAIAWGDSVQEAEKANRLEALKQAWGNIELTADEIHQWVGNLFTFDIEAQVNARKAKVNDVMAMRVDLKKLVKELEGQTVVFLRTGVEDATPEEIEAMKQKVAGVVEKINGILEAQKIMIGVATADGVTITDKDGNNILLDSLGMIEGFQSYITGLGAKIGEYLSDGTKKTLVPDLLKTFNSITRAFTEGRVSTGNLTGIKEIENKYKLEEMTSGSFAQAEIDYAKRYNEAYEVAQAEATAYITNLGGTIAAIEESLRIDPNTPYTQEELDYYKKEFEQFDPKTYILQYMGRTFGAAEAEYMKYRLAAIMKISENYNEGEAFNGNLSNTLLYLQGAERAGSDNRLVGASQILKSEQLTYEWAQNILSNQTGITPETLAAWGINLYDVLSEDTLKQMFESASELGLGDTFIQNVKARSKRDLSFLGYGEGQSGWFYETVKQAAEAGGTPVEVKVVDDEGQGYTPFAYKSPMETYYSMFGGGGGGAPSVTPPSVEGESGKSDENDAEQNRLLGAINTLVQQIANKDFSVKLVPSAQFGRVVNQSVGMYERVAGV